MISRRTTAIRHLFFALIALVITMSILLRAKAIETRKKHSGPAPELLANP